MRLRSERIVTPGGTVGGEVVVRDGRILDVVPLRRGRARPAAGSGPVVELDRRWVVPGYIDTHVHGGGGACANADDPDEITSMARFHAAHGTTALLATTIPAPVDELEAAARAIARSAVRREGACVLGAHLEGPFLSPGRAGALDPKAFLEPDPAVLARLLTAGAGSIRVMTIAPELPGAPELIDSLVSRGVVTSLGHTDATYAQARAAVRRGARGATHLFNAMRPLHHREPGVAGAVLDLPEVSCELICDGIHVDPAALRLALRAKGTKGVRLVTDAIHAAGMPDGSYRLAGAEVIVSAGRASVAGGGPIAGSTLTMDAAVRNAVRFLDLSLEEACIPASSNPARLLGLGDRKGAISPGLDADLVVLDEELRVCGTLIAGAWALGPP
ncbi:MAG: N-acetylglucosamine-6-phosphate deacetylase [Solirubrobacterales bacterium]|nr:N-acetylglucosamine-6-phosphate deacetylase [Solirubrobacterales bacterium]